MFAVATILAAMRLRRNRLLSVASCGAVLFAITCAYRYSGDRDDWVGPRDGHFEEDFTACRARMDEVPFRYGGDVRLIFLDCMEKRGWYLKGRS